MKESFTTIFAYGSLIHDRDLRRTIANPYNIKPAILYGYKRIFNLKSTYRFDPDKSFPISVLNLYVTSKTEYVNGICFDMDNRSFDELMEREKGYELLEKKVLDYNNKDTCYDAKCFIAEGYEPYPYLVGSKLQADYLALCLEGCLKYGQKYLDDFKMSTEFYGVDSANYGELVWKRNCSQF